jgi:hypothetical protein
MSRHRDLLSSFLRETDNPFTGRYYYGDLTVVVPSQHISHSIYWSVCNKPKTKLEDLIFIFSRNNNRFFEFSKYNILVAKGTIIDSTTFKFDVITFIKNKNQKHITLNNKRFHRNTNLLTYVTHEFIKDNNKLFLALLEHNLKNIDLRIVSRDELDMLILKDKCIS